MGVAAQGLGTISGYSGGEFWDCTRPTLGYLKEVPMAVKGTGLNDLGTNNFGKPG